MCLDYCGLGPVVLVCWPPSRPIPRAVRLAGSACRKAADLLDDGLTWLEGRLFGHRVMDGPLGRLVGPIDAWLSVTGIGYLSRQARALDPNDCGHPACEPREPCKFPET